jgi:hypothetical protein
MGNYIYCLLANVKFMLVKELFEKIEQIKKDNPTLEIDNMEIGPLFNGGVIMMTSNIYLVDDGAWTKTEINGEKAIAIEWHC